MLCEVLKWERWLWLEKSGEASWKIVALKTGLEWWMQVWQLKIKPWEGTTDRGHCMSKGTKMGRCVRRGDASIKCDCILCRCWKGRLSSKGKRVRWGHRGNLTIVKVSPKFGSSNFFKWKAQLYQTQGSPSILRQEFSAAHVGSTVGSLGTTFLSCRCQWVFCCCCFFGIRSLGFLW